jgi:hypothetical protein
VSDDSNFSTRYEYEPDNPILGISKYHQRPNIDFPRETKWGDEEGYHEVVNKRF